jgi:outer membrane biogenesis lipoprotein LolB
LEETIKPVAAVTAGAQWQVDYGTWQNSGATITNLPVGNHTVSFSTISGWITPANQTVAVNANSTAKGSGTYVAIGSLQVTLSPAAATNGGAQWQVDFGAWQNSGATVTNLSATNHTVSFSAIFGWTTPSNQTVSVKGNSTAKATGTYVAEPGSLTVNISPPAAVTNGAKWQVDGGKWQNSGATVTNLAPGIHNHQLSFNTITGWITPSNQTVSISNNLTTTASGTYVVQTGSLQVTLSPAAITNVAQWQVDYGTWQNSGGTITNLPVGNHTVSFKGIDYWSAPANQTVLIKANSVAKATGTYTFNAAGIYNGLFAQGDTKVISSGMLSGLAVTASGTYSGKLLIGDSTNAISGGFNASGKATNNVARAAKQVGPLTLVMQVDWNDSPLNIGGTVSGTNGGDWTANLTAELASGGTNSAEYTALLSPAGPLPGYGYLLMTNHAGAVVLSGAVADGTSFSQSVPVSGAGDLPVYGNLYGSTGLLIGWIGLESGAPVGNLTWIKEASHSSALYTNGFTNPVVALQGSVWTNPLPHTAAIDLPSGELKIAGGGLLSPLTFNVALSNNNTFVKLAGSPTNSLTGTNNPKTGLLTITFGNGAGKSTTTATGAVLQNATNGGGFFLGTTNAGSIRLQP